MPVTLASDHGHLYCRMFQRHGPRKSQGLFICNVSNQYVILYQVFVACHCSMHKAVGGYGTAREFEKTSVTKNWKYEYTAFASDNSYISPKDSWMKDTSELVHKYSR